MIKLTVKLVKKYKIKIINNKIMIYLKNQL